MKFVVQGQYNIELFINNQPYALNNSNFSLISVIQNCICFLPTFKLILRDLTGKLIDQYSLKDGSLIDINIGNNDLTQKMKFRVYGVPVSQPGINGPEIKMVGYLDHPKYLMKLVEDSDYTDTSSNIIKRITQICGLDNDIDTTNDKMTWVPGRKNYSSFAKHLCDYAWNSNTSAFSIGVDFNKKLHFKDVAKLIKSKPIKQLYWGAPSNDLAKNVKAYNCLMYNIKTLSGILNKWAGYGMKLNQEQLDGTYIEHKNVQATRLSNYMEMDGDLKQQIDTARIEYFPPNCGNVHSKYETAFHQNRRIRSTFSTLVELITDQFTQSSLFDVVRWQMLNQVDRSVNSAYNGIYIVAASALMITGQNYYEKIRLYSTGRQTDTSGSMV